MATNWGTGGSTARTDTSKVLEVSYVKDIMGAGGSNIEGFEEDASATFEAGQWVYIVAGTGQIDEPAAGIASVLGVALKDKTGTQGSLIPVYLAGEGRLFLMTADADVLQAMVGDMHDLDGGVGGVHKVDIGGTTDLLFKIVALMPGATDSTHVNYRKVLVSVDKSQIAATGGQAAI